MTAGKTIRLSKLAREFNVGIHTIVEFLHKKGFDLDSNPNTKVSEEAIALLEKEYKIDLNLKKESEKIILKSHRPKQEVISIEDQKTAEEENEEEEPDEEIVLPKVSSKESVHARPSVTPEKRAREKTSEEEIKKKFEAEIKEIKEKKEEKKEKEKIAAEEKKEQEKRAEAEKIEREKQVEAEKLEREKIAEEKKKEAEKPEKTGKKEIKEEAVEIIAESTDEEKEEKEEIKRKETIETAEKKEIKEPTDREKEKEEVSGTTEKTVEETVVEKEEIKVEQPVSDKDLKEEPKTEAITAQETVEELRTEVPRVDDVKVVGRINLDSINQKTRPAKKSRKEKEKERKERFKKRIAAPKPEEKKSETKAEKVSKAEEIITVRSRQLSGPTVVGKIDLPEERTKKAKESADSSGGKRRRKRIKESGRVKFEDKQADKGRDDKKIQKTQGRKKKVLLKKEVDEEEVQKQIKDTLARLTSKGKSKGSKHRRDKRAAISERMHADIEKQNQQKNVLKVTEFVSANELANMMNVNVNEIISTCMSLGLFVSINQRLDAETLSIVAEEFGYSVEFVSVDIQEAIETHDDTDDDLISRSPIVTVMGHVDHGKTSLLDHIRNTNVIAGEAGGITQHIGAYNVRLDDGKTITFLDTPGHEAFTAMRARGAQVTDIAIIIIAADDNVMPQTVEAINHATAAGVPIVFAINKIDKPGANPEKIKEELAKMNFLIEEWGGKYQSQDISAKKGDGIEELLEKVLLEAEMLELKANPNRMATGTIIESSLDRGRGYVATVLVQNGTLRAGDIILAGKYFGHIKAMFNERNQKIEKAGPAEAAIILGLDGAPQAGDNFNVLESEREARNIANKREQLAREQGLRSQKHITLDEIGRRIAIGNFQELNLIIKGDVDGSVEALSDSLIKLSTEEIQVNVKHKAVGQISESDILLAAASEAIVIGFQVRPSLSARKLAEREQIDIRLYSIIYDAINEIKDAMEGM
ncbi:MAG: translation initiation factor IF-2, partial [Spirochaetia bacterium]|nr:translation initiation factor IF-2 [Spirochaetia bacterium]